MYVDNLSTLLCRRKEDIGRTDSQATAHTLPQPAHTGIQSIKYYCSTVWKEAESLVRLLYECSLLCRLELLCRVECSSLSRLSEIYINMFSFFELPCVCEQGQGWSACFRHLSEAPPSTFIFLKCSHQSADRRREKNDDQKGVLPPGISFSSSY